MRVRLLKNKKENGKPLGTAEDGTAVIIEETEKPCANWENVVEGHDFVRLKNGGYKAVLGDIEICAYSVQDRLEMIIPCASALVDDEGAIEKYLKEQFSDMKNVTVSFELRRLRIAVIPEKLLSDELLESILDIVRKSDEKYDFLPACMHCGSVMPVVWDTDTETGSPMAVCEICRSAKQLQDKHERIIRDQKDAQSGEYIGSRIPKRATWSSVKAGIHGGFYASILGLFIILISYLAPPLAKFVLFVPGAIAGVIASRDINKLDQIGFAPKVAIAFVSAFTTILVLSSFNLLVLCRCLGYHTTSYALGSAAMYQVVMGIGTYAVAQTAYMLWFS